MNSVGDHVNFGFEILNSLPQIYFS